MQLIYFTFSISSNFFKVETFIIIFIFDVFYFYLSNQF